MSEKGPNYRMERIERLLHELRYEVELGMMQGEVDETLGFEFIVPVSKTFPKGVVNCSFRTRPAPHLSFSPSFLSDSPRLRIVKDTTHDQA